MVVRVTSLGKDSEWASGPLFVFMGAFATARWTRLEQIRAIAERVAPAHGLEMFDVQLAARIAGLGACA